MKNPISFLFRSLSQLCGRIVRRAVLEALSEPKLRKAILRPLVGTALLPIQGGMACPTVTGPGSSPGSTANKLTKWADTSCTLADTVAVYEESSGNVGIGTSSPSAPLHVKVSGTTDPVVRVEGANQSDGLSIKVTHPNAVIGFALAGHSTDFFGSAVQDDAVIFAAAGKNLLFGFGSTECMRITGGSTVAGNVGIGTTSPSSLLHVLGSQPADSSGAGTAAKQVLQISGAKGGNTTATSGQTGGAGASVNITAGAGGNAAGTSNNGDGGSIILQPGAAGTGGASGSGKPGSVIIGGTAYKQVNGGPELISAQGASQDNVVLWCGLTTDTNARFLFSYRGFLEWGAGGSADQDIALFRSGGKGIAIQNFTSTEPDKAFAVNLASGSGADESPEVFAVDTRNKMVRVTGAKLTAKGASSYDATGTVSTTNGQATVAGSGTSFRTQVRIGDRIKIVTTGEIKTVTAVTSDTSLTVDSTFGPPTNPSTMTVLLTAAGTVSVNISSNAVAGSGTSFTKQVGLGDRITVSGHSGTFTVISIASDTSLTVDSNFTSNLSGKIMSILPSIFHADDSAGNAKVFVSDQGNLGIGTTNPAAKVQVVGGDVYISDVGKGIILKSPDGTKCARISLNDAGVLITTSLTCP